MRRYPLRSLLAVAVSLAPVALARAEAPARAREPPPSMQAVLEKTVLRIDVLRVEIRFDEQTRQALASAVQGRAYSPPLANQVALIASKADAAEIRMTFLREVSLRQFLDGVREDLTRAVKAGLISRSTFEEVSAKLPGWFGSLERRGFQAGDRLVYRVQPRSLTTVLQDRRGRPVDTKSIAGEAARDALLGAYFAPGASVREPLIRSLFR